jgi:topoisomerase-4 subunit B
MSKAVKERDLFDYDEDSIKSLDWKEHIRLRPGMYIGKLGDGSSPDDGIYVLVKKYWIIVLMSLPWVTVKR